MNDQNYVITQYAPGSRVYCDVDFNFEKSALEVFRYQSAHCPVYNEFLQSFERNFDDMTNIAAIPFLPIEAFKYHEVQTGLWHAAQIFRSSGTQGRVRAQHLVKNVEDYLRHTIHLFSNVFGELSQFQVMALLPNYLEAGDSSLVAMVRGFMHSAGQEKEMFFLHDFESLQKEILKCSQINQPILLFGVTFALLDFASAFPTALPPDSLLVETGGMKGRGQELNRNELHQFLSKQFSVPYVYSEYGMTELMSQAYTRRGDRYIEPPSMRVVMKEINDPMTQVAPGKVGIINIIDLANVHTCSFLATGDLGIKHSDGAFEVIGRLDHSDIRGCHLMYL